MKIAILICNEFQVLGGAERFILDVAKALKADIICPNYNKDVIKTYDPDGEINFISLNKHLPGEPLRQIVGMNLYKNLKLDYDFYIAMDDMSVHFLNKDIPHLYYALTPRRAFYDMYYETIESYPLLKRLIFKVGLNIFSEIDRSHVKKNIKNITTISHNSRNRIYKVYQKDATVVYPPVHIENYTYKPHEGYWLSVNRIDKWKRIELQIEAFRNMPEKQLIVVGKVYPEYKKIVKNVPKNITFISGVSEDKLYDLYSKCIGLITTAIDEDYGLTPVEAMASGKPVVATKEGGYLETVIDGHTGILVAPDVNEIIQAVNVISNNPQQYKDACIKQAYLFDYEVFKEKINKLVEYVRNP